MPPVNPRPKTHGVHFTPRPKPQTKVLNHGIIGDIVGVPYEFFYANIYTKNFELFDDPNRPNSGQDSIYSDDSLTQDYIARALMESWGKSDEEIVAACTKGLKDCVQTYAGRVAGGFGSQFVAWGNKPGLDPMPPTSCGNGSAMRVGAVAWMCNSLEQARRLARLTAMPSHSHPEGIKGAEAIASAAYLARAGVDKESIKTYLETEFGYNLDVTLAEYRQRNIDRKAQGYGQDEIAPVSVPMAFRCFYEGENFEDCLRNAISVGGDSDTLGIIQGDISGAFYPMSKELEEECEKRQNARLKDGTNRFESFIATLDTEPRMDEVELAIANAKLKKYVMQKAKAGDQTAPENDPEFMELMAEKEALRLFYEEESHLLEGHEERSPQMRARYEQMLADNKDAYLQELRAIVKASPELRQQCAEMKTWPVETVPDKDWLSNRKENGKWIQDDIERVQADVKRIPEKILSGDNIPGLALPDAPNMPQDAQIITGKPADIYMAILQAVRQTPNIPRGHATIALRCFDQNVEDYQAAVKGRINLDEPISIDLSNPEMSLETIMGRLGVDRKMWEGETGDQAYFFMEFFDEGVVDIQPDEGLSHAYYRANSAAINSSIRDNLQRSFKANPTLSIKDAQDALNNGNFVDLSRIAEMGMAAGQAGAMGMAQAALKKEDEIAPEDSLNDVLNALKDTEGTIFRYSTKEYDRVRDTLSNVVKLHKKLQSYIDAPEGSVSRKQFNKTADDLREAYENLDLYADKYLSVKSDRLIQRANSNSPDSRGNKRYNIIASLRTATGPEMRKKMSERLQELGRKITKPANAEKANESLNKNASKGKNASLS